MLYYKDSFRTPICPMPSPENQSVAPEQPKDIPGFKGLERLDKIEALKKGAFREFLNKVMAIRQNPEEQKKVADALTKIDNDTSLTDTQKKEQLRSRPAAELFATIGKNIELGEKGMSVTFDFGKLAFAEQKAIGAGHMLPQNISKVQFGEGARAAESKRTTGIRGGEYRSQKETYMSSFTGTKVFIKYEDILPLDADQMKKAEAQERTSIQKKVAVTEKAHDDHATLRTTEKVAPPAESKDAKEELVTHNPVFIGDSQVQGLKPSLARKGIRAFDFVGKRMETIASRIQSLPENEKAAIKNADTIVLQCGGNNLAMNENYPLEKMQKNFYALLNAVKSINPNVRVRVGTLMAPGNGSSSKETRFAYNAWLKEESVKTGRFSIVDTYALTEDPANPGHRIEALFGGVNNPHMKMSQYAKLSPKLLEAMNYQGK